MPLLSPCPCCLASPLLAPSLQGRPFRRSPNWPCPVCPLPMFHDLPDPDPSLDPSTLRMRQLVFGPNPNYAFPVLVVDGSCLFYLSFLPLSPPLHTVSACCPRCFITDSQSKCTTDVENRIQSKNLSLCVSKATCLWSQRHLLQCSPPIWSQNIQIYGMYVGGGETSE
jgi:hypothetical protein